MSNGHIFISYTRLDEEKAIKLHDDLESSDIDAWLDQYDIPPGSDWDAEIDKGLMGARAVAVILTPSSVLSAQVKGEWISALNRFIPIIPLLFKPCEIPRTLKVFNFIDFTENYEKRVSKLRKRLRTLETEDTERFQNLNVLRKAFLSEQAESTKPERFQTKIEEIDRIIGGWDDRRERQSYRVVSGLEREHEQIVRQDQFRRSLSKERVVGARLQDISEYFKNRTSVIDHLGQLLEKDTTKVITIVGRGGIGKTAIASKLLADLELNKWPHTTNGPTVDGIVYMSTNMGSGISLEQIFLKCSRLLGDQSAEVLWTNQIFSIDEKITELISKFKSGIYILLFDNMENLLDTDCRVKDPQLQRFIDLLVSMPSKLRLLITSREKIDFGYSNLPFCLNIPVDEGLPTEEGIEFLREMDPQGEYGLAKTSDSDLAGIVEIAHGVPRALQLFANILVNDPFISFEKLSQIFYDKKDVVTELVQESYKRLDNNVLFVLLSLSVFRRAVTIVAIEYLLEPFAPGLDVPSILGRLARTQMVGIDRITDLISLHPIDRDWVYSLHRNSPHDGFLPSLADLESRAAEYYRQQRRSKKMWQAIEDLDPQIYEIEHLSAAGKYMEAFRILNEIDDDYLEVWGYYDRLIQMREDLSSHLTNSAAMHNLSRLGRLYALLGQIKKAVVYFQDALTVAKQFDDRDAESYILGRLGSCYHDLNQIVETRSTLEKALLLARDNHNLFDEANNLFVLGKSFRGTHEMESAIKLINQALEILNTIEKDQGVSNIKIQYLIAKCLGSLGLCYNLLGDADRAMSFFQQSLDYNSGQGVGNRGGKANRLTNISSLYRKLGKLNQALSLSQQALDIYYDIKDRWGEGNTMRIIAFIYSDMGMFKKASDHFQKALDIYAATNDTRSEGIALLGIANNYRRNAQIYQAIEYNRSSIEIFKNIQANFYHSHAAVELAWSLLIAGNMEEAERFAKTAYKQQIGLTMYAALNVLGVIAVKRIKQEEGLTAFRETLTGTSEHIALRTGYCNMKYTQALAQAGLAALEKADIANAVNSYKQAREICDAPGILVEQTILLKTLDMDPKLQATVLKVLED